ncbi:hypothetical protein ACE7GA_04600 [Roseomonas sp. CCTCC AB2023176]|uniref:hypothetical protein n=1 Tax=Roseomonas sp. CCTCC AB2023176 TaxID=3342640 RepID=UPI0035D89244
MTRRGRAGRDVTAEYAVAPVVPFSWTPDRPVTAWAVAPGREAPPGWAERRGRLVALLPDERVEEAVAAAAREARLVNRPGVPVGVWVTGEDDPVRDAATALAVTGLGGLAGWVAALMLSARRQEAGGVRPEHRRSGVGRPVRPRRPVRRWRRGRWRGGGPGRRGPHRRGSVRGGLGGRVRPPRGPRRGGGGRGRAARRH